MKMRIGLTLALLFLAFTFAKAQVIPENRRVNWSNAGFRGEYPSNNSLIIDVTDYGAVGDSVTDNYDAIIFAMDSVAKRNKAILYFPPGKYWFRSTIRIRDSIVFRGAGADSTQLLVREIGAIDGLEASKTQNDSAFVEITSGFNEGSTNITVSNVNGFAVGDFIQIIQDNGNWDLVPSDWGTSSIGLITRVVSINGNALVLREPIRISLESSLNPRVRPINPAKHIGIECLKIIRENPPTIPESHNINFKYAVDCWVIGVESEKSMTSHIMIEHCSHITVSGCYIHDAYEFDGSRTRGYGVTLRQQSSDILIENNIFQKLRHAINVKEGTNGSVIAYNYATEPNRSEFPFDASGDISLHGHYSFANLYEGNIVQNIVTDHTWGATGPDNVFFRNRAELYGITMTPALAVATDSISYVGNTITNNGNPFGNFFLSGSNHFLYGNNIKGILEPPQTGTLTDQSYFYCDQPSYWNVLDQWPPIGPPNGLFAGSNPAATRFNNKDVVPNLTYCDYPRIQQDCNPVNIDDNIQSMYADFSCNVYPNPFDNQLVIEFVNYQYQPFNIQLLNLVGQVVFSKNNLTTANEHSKLTLDISNNIPGGIYLLKVYDGHGIITKKVMRW